MGFEDRKGTDGPNILICTTFYLRLGAYQIGGVEHLSLILISGLRKRGCRFFNAFRATDDNSKDDELDEHYFLESERIRITDETSCDELSKFLAGGNIRIIHIQQAESRDYLLYREAAERVGAVVITTMNKKPLEDLFTFRRAFLQRQFRQSNFQGKMSALKKMLFSGRLRKKRQDQIRMKTMNTFSLSHMVVFLSRNYIPGYENLLQRELSAEDSECSFSVIPNCVTFGNYFPEIHIPRLKQKEILVIGTLEESTRRISLIIRMWKDLKSSFPDWTVRILGDGPSSGRYRSMIAKTEGITLEGRQEPESYYRTASIYINLSITDDAWSMSLLEAMQYALVPVVFNTSEIYSDVIEHGHSGFIIEDMATKELEQVLRRLMRDEGMRHSMARNSVARSKMFSQLVYCRRYHDLYLHTHRSIS